MNNRNSKADKSVIFMLFLPFMLEDGIAMRQLIKTTNRMI
jgi:hypothetical protein